MNGYTPTIQLCNEHEDVCKLLLLFCKTISWNSYFIVRCRKS